MGKTIESIRQFYIEQALKEGKPEYFDVIEKLREAEKLSKAANGPEYVPLDRIAAVRAELADITPQESPKVEKAQLQNRILDVLITGSSMGGSFIDHNDFVVSAVRNAISDLVTDETPLEYFVLPTPSELYRSRRSLGNTELINKVEKVSKLDISRFRRVFGRLSRVQEGATVGLLRSNPEAFSSKSHAITYVLGFAKAIVEPLPSTPNS